MPATSQVGRISTEFLRYQIYSNPLGEYTRTSPGTPHKKDNVELVILRIQREPTSPAGENCSVMVLHRYHTN